MDLIGWAKQKTAVAIMMEEIVYNETVYKEEFPCHTWLELAVMP